MHEGGGVPQLDKYPCFFRVPGIFPSDIQRGACSLSLISGLVSGPLFLFKGTVGTYLINIKYC